MDSLKNISSESQSTPALIHMTDHSWKQQRHILPVLITSRSLFLIEIDAFKNEKEDDGIIVEEDAYRCITCITGALSEKASTKLQEKRLNPIFSNPFLCSYPKIVVVGTCTSNDEHTMVQSKIDNIDQWIKLNCSDTAWHNVERRL